MANRTYAPELAARLAMADSEARAAVAAQADGEGSTDSSADSDEDSLQSPGRADPSFLMHDSSDSAMEHTPGSGLGDQMEIDTLSVSPTMSEATTVRGEDAYPTRADRQRSQPIHIANIPSSPHLLNRAEPPSPSQLSDRENVHPHVSDFDDDEDDPLGVPFENHTVHQDYIFNHDEILPDDFDSHFPTPANDPTLSHLREISSLASWTVSSYKIRFLGGVDAGQAWFITKKQLSLNNEFVLRPVVVQPSCGVAALLSPSTRDFWQSDGPQPHLLNIHFFKLVRIVKLRIYLDFELDESYTPTRLSFAAGTHEYDAVEFAEWRWDSVGPKGWVDVDLSQCGSDEERERELADEVWSDESSIAGVLRCFFLQVRVLENHQNGKDTHIRGVQIFARDERARTAARPNIELDNESRVEEIRQGIEEVDWMGEPELR